nr:hypothetical protein [Tanacetum cinerariifolium]
MSNKNQSSRRQKKVPRWFSDHVMDNPSQKKNDDVATKGVFGNEVYEMGSYTADDLNTEQPSQLTSTFSSSYGKLRKPNITTLSCMSNKNQSSRRQKKVPRWFSDHVMDNPSQKKNDDVVRDNKKENRVCNEELNDGIGETKLEATKGVFGNEVYEMGSYTADDLNTRQSIGYGYHDC